MAHTGTRRHSFRRGRTRGWTFATVITAVVLAAIYITFLIVRPDSGADKQCVNTRTMTVTVASHCQDSSDSGTSTTGVYRWYWGYPAQVGDRVHGGSFRNPDKERQYDVCGPRSIGCG